MLTIRIKYYIFCLLSFICFSSYAQEQADQSVVTIIGDEAEEVTETNDFIKTNPTSQDSQPALSKKLANENQKVIAVNKNGDVQLRFDNNNYLHPAERLGGSAYANYSSYSNKDYFDNDDKAPKRATTLAELKFNFKKRFRALFPARKKKYRPTLCGRF